MCTRIHIIIYSIYSYVYQDNNSLYIILLFVHITYILVVYIVSHSYNKHMLTLLVLLLSVLYCAILYWLRISRIYTYIHIYTLIYILIYTYIYKYVPYIYIRYSNTLLVMYTEHIACVVEVQQEQCMASHGQTLSSIDITCEGSKKRYTWSAHL